MKIKDIFKRFKSSIQEPEKKEVKSKSTKAEYKENKDFNELIKLMKTYFEFKNSEFQDSKNLLLIKEKNEIAMKSEIPKIMEKFLSLDKEEIVKDLHKIRRKSERYDFGEHSLNNLEVKNYFFEKYSINTAFLRYIFRDSEDNKFKTQLTSFILGIERLLQKKKEKDYQEIAEKIYNKVKKENLSIISVAQTRVLIMDLGFSDFVQSRDDISLIRELILNKLSKEILIEEKNDKTNNKSNIK